MQSLRSRLDLVLTVIVATGYWQMSKHQMIEAIQRHNPSATEEFLVAFDEHSLGSYLRRLTELKDRRGRASVWVREVGGSPAITMPDDDDGCGGVPAVNL